MKPVLRALMANNAAVAANVAKRQGRQNIPHAPAKIALRNYFLSPIRGIPVPMATGMPFLSVDGNRPTACQLTAISGPAIFLIAGVNIRHTDWWRPMVFHNDVGLRFVLASLPEKSAFPRRPSLNDLSMTVTFIPDVNGIE